MFMSINSKENWANKRATEEIRNANERASERMNERTTGVRKRIAE